MKKIGRTKNTKRDKKIIAMLAKGSPQKVVAEKFGLQIPSIRKIVSEHNRKNLVEVKKAESAYCSPFSHDDFLMIKMYESLYTHVSMLHIERDDIRTNKGYTRRKVMK
jgi:hypothetical protein